MRVLLVEDESVAYSQHLERLPDAGIEVTLATDSRSAKAQFKARAFDAVLIDLMLDADAGQSKSAEPQYTGIPLGAELRKRDSNVLIVMYSTDIRRGSETDFSHHAECLTAGADHVLSRTWLMSSLPETLASQIKAWKDAKQDQQRAISKFTFSPHLDMKAVVERVGDEDLREIVSRCLPSFSFHVVNTIGGGYSGAILLSIASGNTEECAEARNVIKISKSAVGLEQEIQKRPKEGTNLQVHGVAPQASAPLMVQGWYAFAVPEVRKSITLEQFLLSRTLTTRNKAVLRKVVTTLLVEPASTATEPEGNTKSELVPLRYTFLASVDAVLDELTSYCRVNRKEALSAIDIVKRYVIACTNGFLPLRPSDHRTATLHGDFHARNVLLKSSGEPFLIDFARSSTLPRLFDFAALEADLIIRVMDMPDGNQWVSKRLDSWLDVMGSGFPLSRDESTPTDCLLFLRHLLHRSLCEDVAAVSPREYSDVLLFQILRYMRFSNISVFKRILSVHWAARLLDRYGMTCE